ncbi:MAG TPA: nitroreductase family protein [Amnibacterium sp.]|jgi:nitroreductase|uniref:nitroreductase family protein n=1 Tax=Amnibacterium sp. TaxID=1872496 RepID=UPI002F944683
MTLLTDTRRAETAAPLHDLLAERWSPRSFDPEFVVPDEAVTALMEAARWAPSAANFQPRRFIVARRGSEAFQAVTDALSEGNRPWAPNASLFVVAIALTKDADGKPYRWAEYDAGQAIAHLTVQAHALGLHVHPMGGFDPEAIALSFELPEGAVAVSVNAIGAAAPADLLPERYRSREAAPRTRLPLEELVVVDD